MSSYAILFWPIIIVVIVCSVANFEQISFVYFVNNSIRYIDEIGDRTVLDFIFSKTINMRPGFVTSCFRLLLSYLISLDSISQSIALALTFISVSFRMSRYRARPSQIYTSLSKLRELRPCMFRSTEIQSDASRQLFLLSFIT